jgi:hypothetical protein
MRKITELIVHCSATQPNWMADKPAVAKLSEIRRWHMDKGWQDIGYHFLVDRDGTVVAGRPIEQPGAHTVGKNATSIGVCLIGGFGSSSTDDPLKHYSPEQLDALRTLIGGLKVDYGFTKVSGHNDYAAKACPGFNVARWEKFKSPERPLSTSRTLVGQTVAATGTGATAVLEIVQEAQTAISPLTEYAETLRWVFIGLVFAGIALTVWARISDWKRGRK